MLGLNTAISIWILYYLIFLSGLATPSTLNSGTPQGWVLSPLLFTLKVFATFHIIKFATTKQFLASSETVISQHAELR